MFRVYRNEGRDACVVSVYLVHTYEKLTAAATFMYPFGCKIQSENFFFFFFLVLRKFDAYSSTAHPYHCNYSRSLFNVVILRCT